MALHVHSPWHTTSCTYSLHRAPMLRHLARRALLPQLVNRLDASSRASLRCSCSSAGSSSDVSPSSSSALKEVRCSLDLLSRSITYEADTGQFSNFRADNNVSFAEASAHILAGVQQQLEAAMAEAAGSSGTASAVRSSPYLVVAPQLQHYADLLKQYDHYQPEQRRSLLEAIQQQLLPQVNSLVGLPISAPRSLRRVGGQGLPTVAGTQLNAMQQPAQQQMVQQPAQQQMPRPRPPRTRPPVKRQPLKFAAQPQAPQGHPQHQQQQHSEQQQQQPQQHVLHEQQTAPQGQQAVTQASAAEVTETLRQQQQQPAVTPAEQQQQQQQPTELQQQQQQPHHPVRPKLPPKLPPRRHRSSSRPSSPTVSSTSAAGPSWPPQNSTQTADSPQAAAHPTGQEDAHTPPPPAGQQQQQQPQQLQGAQQQHLHAPGARGPLMPQQSSPGQLRGGVPQVGSLHDGASAQPHHPAEGSITSTTGSSSSSSAVSLPGSRAMTKSPSGPYPVRRHSAYPLQGHPTPALLPAWQLYFPLPEELGGPPARQTVPAAAAVSAADSSSLPQQQQQHGVSGPMQDNGSSLFDGEGEAAAAAEAEAEGGSSRRNIRLERNKELGALRWQALLTSAQQYQQHMQQEQQRQQQEAAGQLKQRSGAWLQLREGRLTGSVLANMLSWFGGPDEPHHVRLWREKLGLQKPQPSNEAMRYGTHNEAAALSSYQALSPHEVLRDMGFALWGTDNAHDWLAASPDGLITSSGLAGLTHGAAGSSGSSSGAGSSASGAGSSVAEAPGVGGVVVSDEVAAWVMQQTGRSLDGVLEIKCPFKASPQAGSKLPSKMDAYYMPQVQVLCEVLQREWAVVYYWSEAQGSHMTLVHRDRDYFALLWEAMADFWWRHVVPAKLRLDADPAAIDKVLRTYSPRVHPYRDEIIKRSRAMVDAAPHRTFSHEETRPGLTAAAAASPAAAAAVGNAAAASHAAATSAAAVSSDGETTAAVSSGAAAPDAAAGDVAAAAVIDATTATAVGDGAAQAPESIS